MRELGADEDETVDAAAQLSSPGAPGVAPGVVARRVARPAMPLSDTALLTKSERALPGRGAAAELDTADRVDLLCAFVKWHGLRLLEPS